MKREISFSTLVLTVLIGAVLVVAAGLLALSYLGASQVLDDELEQRAREIEEIGSLLIESRLNTGAHSLEDLSRSEALVAAVAERREELTETLLLRAFLGESRASFDFLYIETEPEGIWVETGTPLFDRAAVYRNAGQAAIAAGQWQLLVTRERGRPIAALVSRQPLVQEPLGRVVGWLIAGSLLNDRLPLASHWKARAGAAAIGLFHDDHMILATVPPDSAMAALLHEARTQPSGARHRDEGYFIVNHALRSFAGGEGIRVVALLPSETFAELQDTFTRSLGIVLIVVALVVAVSSFVLRGAVKPALASVLTHARALSERRETDIQKGWIREFNSLNDSLRSMFADLMASEARLRGLVEGSIQGIIVHRDLEPLFANQTAAEILGYEGPEELTVAPDVTALLPPSQRAAFREMMRRQAAPRRFEIQALRRDGTTIWVEAMSGAVDWGGEPAVQTTFVDITERRRGAQALERSRRDLTEAQRLAHIGSWRADLESRREVWSDELFRILGYAPGEIAEDYRIPIEAVHPDDRAQVEVARSALAAEGRPYEREFRFLRRDGEQRVLKAVGEAERDDDGRLVSLRGTLQDVTEQSRDEERLRQAQKMQVVGQLTGGVAHDFNNLLAVVHGNLELIDERIGEDPALAAFVKPAIRAARRGSELTQRLLAFARKQPLSPVVTDVNELARGTIDLLQRSLGETIAIETRLASRPWPALVDPAQLENALLNLAVNARDAMPEGGKLVIETANQALDRSVTGDQEDIEPGDYVMLAVADSGCGISPEIIDHVFEPFFTTKEVGSGSGLGLSMVFGFIKQSQGFVRISSEPGRGTTVRLYLPRDRGRETGEALRDGEARAEGGRARGAEGAGELVLLVEDDPDVLTLASRLLKSLGYRVLEAADGASALAIVNNGSGPIDLLFTDLVLPGGMSGAELAREVQRRDPSIRVLYMSGYTQSAIESQGVLEAGVHLINKPFRKQALATKLQAVLREPPAT